MNKIIYLLGFIVLAGCASQDEQGDPSTQDIAQAVKDFIELRELEEQPSMRSGTNDGWTQIDDTFIVYTARKKPFLVEFARPCWELRDNTRITPDRRWDANTIRSRFDTIRGCRIHRIYGLTEAEAAELKNIGEAPGSRN
ncbi:MAG: DUF6491 family protein [Woeseiaceae bacterium]|nr:DUF6491 family protein [Woeseiaceae bacterium]